MAPVTMATVGSADVVWRRNSAQKWRALEGKIWLSLSIQR
jgi:hypothetical protein